MVGVHAEVHHVLGLCYESVLLSFLAEVVLSPPPAPSSREGWHCRSYFVLISPSGYKGAGAEVIVLGKQARASQGR